MEAVCPKVAVAMSVYNGEDHLNEQIDSVLHQDGVQVTLFVRDDGSRDSSVAILESYEKKGDLRLFRGKNVGVVRSFLSLLELIDSEYEYIALCDQDDVWRQDKLLRALAKLEQQDREIPQLYCSEYIFCDANMRELGPSHLNQIGVDFTKMLYENRVSGNTVVMNRALVDVVVRGGSHDVYCHDWWIALVAAAVGQITFDDYPSLYYRRTGSNVSPTGSGGLRLFRYRINTFFEKQELSRITRQLKKLHSVFGKDMPESRLEELSLFLNGNRWKKALFPRRLRQKLPEELAVRMLFLVGLL